MQSKNKLVKTENEATHLSGGFVIPHEVVDGIVKAAMIESRDYLQSEIDNHYKDGTYLHSDDIPNNRELIYCMNKLIAYYGGE
jgi:hypothetical protein